MAGLAKPNNVNSEVTYTVHSVAAYIPFPNSGLFNGRAGSYGSNPEEYISFQSASHHVEITIDEECNIWTYDAYVGEDTKFVVNKWNGTAWVDVTTSLNEAQRTSASYEQWFKSFSNVPPGRYKFTAPPYRSDGEWYLESTISRRFLFQDGSNIKKYDGTAWSIVGTSPVLESMFETDGMSNLTSINKTALDALNNNDVVLLTHIIGDQSDTQYIKVDYTPKPQLILANGDISLEYIQTIDSISLTYGLSGSIDKDIKLILSTDSGSTWKSYNGSDWVNVNTEDLADVKSKGMTPSVFNTLGNTQFTNLLNGSDKLRFGYYLELGSSTDVVNTDALTMTVDMKGEWKKAVYGSEYKYSYPNDSVLKVKLFTNGNWKVNY